MPRHVLEDHQVLLNHRVAAHEFGPVAVLDNHRDSRDGFVHDAIEEEAIELHKQGGG